MTLYLKYRPKNLDELDLISVRESLKKILSSKHIPHAFLFAGPKGTGKTSAARILAKMINCESKNPPCDKCEQCVSISKGTNVDVIEMDAASHRGIDDIRELREAVKLSPALAKKKVYIIDEAHMLTTEASNALLKTLEEPPSHVVFILATTNPEKLISTIRSRATTINFTKATPHEIKSSLARVAKGENVKVDEKVLLRIANFAGGAFRDAVKLFEQMTSEGIKFDEESLDEYLVKSSESDLSIFFDALARKDAKSGILEIEKATGKGISAGSLGESILGSLQKMLLGKVGAGEEIRTDFSERDLISLIDLFSQSFLIMSESPIEELPLEIAVVKWCGEGKNNESTVGAEKKGEITAEAAVKKEKVAASGVKLEEKTDHEVKPANTSPVTDEGWKEILSRIKPINASVEALLRAARPIGFDGKSLTLGVFYKFHKERLEDVSHRRVVEAIAGEVLGVPLRVICVLTEAPVRKIIEEVKKDEAKPILTEGKDNDIIKAAEEIFGV